MSGEARARWETNPFFVLELAPECARPEVERAAHKLLGLLAIGAASAKTYPTPFGPRPRTEELVRASAAALRDPTQRIVHELWALLGTTPGVSTDAPPPPVWPDARRTLERGPR